MPSLIGRARDLLHKLTAPPGTKSRSLSDPELGQAFGIAASYSGKSVSDFGALQLSTVWACVKLNSEAAASLPLQLFEREANGGRRPADHPLNDVLQNPNTEQTGFEFWQSMFAWLNLRGNAYAEIARLGDRIAALNPIPADRMMVSRDRVTDELRYRFVDRGKPVELPAESVLHIRGFGLGGDLGLSPVQYGAQTLGASTAIEEAAAKFFAQGLSASGFLKTDGEVTLDQREQLNAQIAAFSGSTRAGKLWLLEAGLQFQPISLDPESTQMLESRRFGVEVIARWFGVPPIMIGHAADGQTMWGSGVEAILQQYLTTGLDPFLGRVEQRILKQLIPGRDKARIYAEFNREALLRADSAAKASYLSTMVQNGLMSRAEGRAKLNLPSRDGADVLTAQVNLAPLDRLGGDDPASTIRGALGLGGEQ